MAKKENEAKLRVIKHKEIKTGIKNTKLSKI